VSPFESRENDGPKIALNLFLYTVVQFIELSVAVSVCRTCYVLMHLLVAFLLMCSRHVATSILIGPAVRLHKVCIQNIFTLKMLHDVANPNHMF
jgi:hypothetical protein